MGSASYGYAVELDRLAAAIGGRDEQLLGRLLANAREDPLAQPGEPTLRDGLRALITGPLLPDYHGRAQQLYALEVLCGQFGMALPSQCIGYLDDLGWETGLLESGPPCGLPPADDFPSVAHLTAEQVREEYARISEEEIDEDIPEVAEAQEEFVGWLQQCAKSGRALVTFQY